ncbi:MAG: hypothetical protein KC619_28515 [Myxococcales bacterium]|nr:hypothetical protein [Myxococcales bacterium]
MRLLATILGCSIALSIAGCETRDDALLLEVTDVTPRQVTPGQRLRVEGSGFPPGREARLQLEGVMHRPGAEPARVRVELAGRAASSDRIEARFTRETLAALGGRGTLHGRVVALFDTPDGQRRVTGRSEELELDVHTGSADRLHEEIAHRRAGAQLAERLGLTLAEEAPEARGLPIAVVRESSSAARAGIIEGDRLLGAEGVQVHDPSDLVPIPGRDTIALRLARRGEAAPFEVRVPVESLEGAGVRPETIRATAIGLAWLLLFVVLFAPSAGIADWIAGVGRPRAPRLSLRPSALWLRHRRDVPVVALGVAALAGLPAVDRVVPVEVGLEVVLLAVFALRIVTAWLGAPDGSPRTRARALAGATASVLLLGIGLGAIAVLGGTTDVAALSRQPIEPWSWTLVRWPVAVPALGLVGLGAAWPAAGRHALARLVDDVVLFALAVLTVAVLLGGWGEGEAQGAARLLHGAGFSLLALGLWLWMRRARSAPRAPRTVLLVGGALSLLVVGGTFLLLALEPPDVLTATIARVTAGAAAILLLGALLRALTSRREPLGPLHRFA